MNTLVRFGLSAILGALVLQATNILSYLTFWTDAVNHKPIALVAVFVVLTALIFMALGGYIQSGSNSKVVLPLATILVIIIIAIHVLDVQALITLPKVLLQYADAWYSLIAALAIYFLTLFFA